MTENRIEWRYRENEGIILNALNRMQYKSRLCADNIINIKKLGSSHNVNEHLTAAEQNSNDFIYLEAITSHKPDDKNNSCLQPLTWKTRIEEFMMDYYFHNYMQNSESIPEMITSLFGWPISFWCPLILNIPVFNFAYLLNWLSFLKLNNSNCIIA